MKETKRRRIIYYIMMFITILGTMISGFYMSSKKLIGEDITQSFTIFVLFIGGYLLSFVYNILATRKQLKNTILPEEYELIKNYTLETKEYNYNNIQITYTFSRIKTYCYKILMGLENLNENDHPKKLHSDFIEKEKQNIQYVTANNLPGSTKLSQDIKDTVEVMNIISKYYNEKGILK